VKGSPILFRTEAQILRDGLAQLIAFNAPAESVASVAEELGRVR
jgi:hypothetical protein